MPLPSLDDVTSDVVITFPDNDLTVTFQLRPVPAARWNEILDGVRDDQGEARYSDCGRDLIAAGVRAVYSSVESTPSNFTEADARELWDGWPDWCRTRLLTAVVLFNTRGAQTDPKGRSNRNGVDESSTLATVG